MSMDNKKKADLSENEEIDIQKINYSDFLKSTEEIEKELINEEANKKKKAVLKKSDDPFENNNENEKEVEHRRSKRIKEKNEKKKSNILKKAIEKHIEETVEVPDESENFNKNYSIFEEKLDESNESENADDIKYNKIKRITSISAVACFVLVVLYLVVGFGYYSNKFLPSTIINGVDCSGKTVEYVSDIMKDKIKDYHLSIVNGDVIADELYGTDINLEYGDMDIVLKDICDNQQKTSWLKGLIFKSEPISTSKGLKYDTVVLNQFINSSLILGMSGSVKSVNAGIEFNNGEYVITPAVYGDEIDTEVFINKIIACVNSLDDTIDINNDDCFVKPKLTEDNKNLISSCKEANKIINNKIELNITDDLFEIPIDIKKDWLSVDVEGMLIFDTQAFNKYLDKLDKSYSMNEDVRDFDTYYGDTVQVKGGDFNTAVNRDKLIESMSAAMLDNKDARVVAEFVDRSEFEIGNSYIEVDLSNQMLWMYVNGENILGTPIITGKEDGEHNTPEGVYRLKSKTSNRIISENGENKEVKYFISINGEMGICDASWKNLFGGVVYKEEGSDGSIYVLEESAKTIYENYSENMPIICYYHEIMDSFYYENSYMGQLMDLIANKPEIPEYEDTTEETTDESSEEATNEEETSEAVEKITEALTEAGNSNEEGAVEEEPLNETPQEENAVENIDGENVE